MSVEDYITKDNKNLWNFENVTDVQYANVCRIHPLKQLDIYYLIEAAKRDEGIRGLVVFGSAARFDCGSFSDLDILVIRDDRKYKFDFSYDQVKSDVDILYSWNSGSEILKEIKNTGVLVYMRGEASKDITG